MSSPELGQFLFAFGLLLGAATVLGYLFERLRQPKLVGEILAGILLGPFILGKIDSSTFEAFFGAAKSSAVFGVLYWAGLLLLMFLSGTEMRRLFASDTRREVGWLCGVGTLLPFALVLISGILLPIDLVAMSGVPHTSVLIVVAAGVAVTSIPVISRIFHDLGILKTRFSALILGAAALDDVILWGALAIATALVRSGAAASIGDILYELGVTLAFMAFGFFAAPAMLRRVNKARQNILARTSPLGYAVLVLLAYTTLAASLRVDLVFAAFLAGYGLMAGGSKSSADTFSGPLEAVKKVAFSVFIPVYFALIGQKLIFGRGFSWRLFLLFLLASTLCRMLAAGAASYLAGFRGLDPFNISIALNARGGPGIVLASVAFEAGIINASFYTALVLTALLTSQAAGAWLMYVLRKGWPLLSERSRLQKPLSVVTPKLAA